jgi:D-psicose/D-tagatose/L-ribulose 3-epimerase
MPTFGAHAFVWIGAWTPEAGDATIRDAAQTGFDFLEVPLLEPERFAATRHRETLEAVGLRATCSLILPKHAHMPDAPEAAKDFLLRALDQAAALGSDYLAGCIAYHLGHLTGEPPTARERETVISVLREVAGEAAARGITLGLEACNRYETHLYNTLAEKPSWQWARPTSSSTPTPIT